MASAPLRAALRSHGVPLVLFLVLASGLTWPLAHHFARIPIGNGNELRHNLWVMWNVQQWLLGEQPLFYAPSLYFPTGISLLAHGVGPISGVLALPFWWLGPHAAYNGALLLGLVLTGYCAFLLARSLDLDLASSVFVGIMAQVAPLHLAGMHGHIEKVFTGLLALVALTAHQTLRPDRSVLWAPATGFVLLLTALHSGYQFVYALLLIGYFTLWGILDHRAAETRHIVGRLALLGGSCLFLVGPLVLAQARAARDPAFQVDVLLAALQYSPDAIQLLAPSCFSALLGEPVVRRLAPVVPRLCSIEAAISVLLVSPILAGVAVLRGGVVAMRWAVLAGLASVLALGPLLKVGGDSTFTSFDLPIILPYAFFVELPGLEFMRVPGRFMLLGGLAIAVTAGFGLWWLRQRFYRGRHALVAVAILLVLLEGWPRPWPYDPVPPIPDFYRQIQDDRGAYAVLDLPPGWPPNGPFAPTYQYFQMTHRKPIAYGYLSRTYHEHPLPLVRAVLDGTFVERDAEQVGLLVNGRPANTFLNAPGELGRLGYRYVVLHKTLAPPSDAKLASLSAAFIASVFAGRTPQVDDALVTVYELPVGADASQPQPTIRWGSNWRYPEAGWRWATTPAQLVVDSPREQTAEFEILPAMMHEPSAKDGVGHSGVLSVVSPDGRTVSVPLVAQQVTRVPITLRRGEQTFTLSLQAGNFQPMAYGSTDPSVLSFAVRTINLLVAP